VSFLGGVATPEFRDTLFEILVMQEEERERVAFHLFYAGAAASILNSPLLASAPAYT
jgi:hypothetical protein